MPRPPLGKTSHCQLTVHQEVGTQLCPLFIIGRYEQLLRCQCGPMARPADRKDLCPKPDTIASIKAIDNPTINRRQTRFQLRRPTYPTCAFDALKLIFLAPRTHPK